VIEKGQVLTHYYRVMNKNGGYTWIQTCATIVCNAKNNDEQHIICVNYVISARENTNLIMDQCQLEIIKREIREPVTIEKDIKSPIHDSKDDSPDVSKNFVKIESPIADTKTLSGNSKKLSPEAKIEEPATRGRKRKNKQEPQESKKQPLPPAATILNESSCKDADSVKDRSESSVKDLENAMSKHLPSPSSNHATDFSTDSLLKHQDKESWNAASAAYPEQQSPVMPATSLLRQLYANRESVIRAARPSYVYPDGALPTPPGEYPNESYPTNYATSYGSNPVEYNNNTMTPPSSVSPRDLSNLSSKAAAASYEYNHYPPPNESTVLQLPLKPQPYSIHPNYPPEGHSQYFTHHPGFWYPTPT
jgi:neuronal PAS domain-containing protein 1/3